MANLRNEDELHEYSGGEIKELPPSKTKIPTFLKWTYVILPIWGVITWFYFIDGSRGWLDRGYWQQLQQAAQTTNTPGKKPVIIIDNTPLKKQI